MKEVAINFTLNGKEVSALTPPGLTLLKFLRERMGLTGAKAGCERGECGACTVLLNGEAVDSCLVLAVQVDGCRVETIEGLEKDGEIHPIQQAFIDQTAIQCGYCTPGMVMAAKGLLDHNPDPDMSEIKVALSGNLCRCTGYTKIFEAVKQAAQTLREG